MDGVHSFSRKEKTHRNNPIMFLTEIYMQIIEDIHQHTPEVGSVSTESTSPDGSIIIGL
jgi:hypothetical protein